MKRGREWWMRHVAAWQASGLSQVEYCRRHKVVVGSFGRWASKLRSEAGRSLVEVSRGLPSEVKERPIELVGEKGRIILTRHHGTIDIVSDYGKQHEVLDQRSDNFGDTHFGADDQFIFALDAFCKGEQPVVTAAEGLLASRMVEAAQLLADRGGALVFISDVEDV